MLKRLTRLLLSRLLNTTPSSFCTIAVCASTVLISACASDNAYEANTHIPSINYSSSNYSSKDIWQRIRDNTGIPDLYNDDVSKKEAYYSARADYVNRMASRSGDFLYLIMNEVERRHMPSEIALLPFVESAFVTTASSPVKASGLWQFMPATGRDFSLQQNRFADQRNDVVASTDAALTFLQRLHDQFGDWQLALAAYNWGPGNVAKAVRRAQAAGLAGTYSDIKMPRETREYIPKLQAIKNIIKDPARFGITLPEISNDKRHAVITVTRDIDVSKAAELAGMDINSFKRINPAFKEPVIAASLGSKILVPINRASIIRSAFLDPSRNLASLTTYTAYNTVSLTDIASQFNTDENTLRLINNIPAFHNYVTAGSSLLVPRQGKNGQDIPYQALNEGLTTTTGDVGLGNDYTVEAPTLLASSDDQTRQDRSGIIGTNNLFASNTTSANTGPGLAYQASSSSDDLAHIINNSAKHLKDPTPASGALVYNNSARGADVVANITPPNNEFSNSEFNNTQANLTPPTPINIVATANTTSNTSQASASALNQVASTHIPTASTKAPLTLAQDTHNLTSNINSTSTDITPAIATDKVIRNVPVNMLASNTATATPTPIANINIANANAATTPANQIAQATQATQTTQAIATITTIAAATATPTQHMTQVAASTKDVLSPLDPSLAKGIENENLIAANEMKNENSREHPDLVNQEIASNNNPVVSDSAPETNATIQGGRIIRASYTTKQSPAASIASPKIKATPKVSPKIAAKVDTKKTLKEKNTKQVATKINSKNSGKNSKDVTKKASEARNATHNKNKTSKTTTKETTKTAAKTTKQHTDTAKTKAKTNASSQSKSTKNTSGATHAHNKAPQVKSNSAMKTKKTEGKTTNKTTSKTTNKTTEKTKGKATSTEAKKKVTPPKKKG